MDHSLAGAVGFTSDVRSDAIRWLVEAYLRRLHAKKAAKADYDEAIVELTPKLIHDAWVFAPLAALMKAFDFFYEVAMVNLLTIRLQQHKQPCKQLLP